MCGLESFCGHENDEPTTRDHPVWTPTYVLVKAGSIQGNKQPVTVIYTPASNILKRGDYATGSGAGKASAEARPQTYFSRLTIALTRSSIRKRLTKRGQLVKAGSIQGNKQPVTVIYTPASNILKRGDYATWNRFPRHALRHANIDVRT
jgi:hypothetical protein